MPAFRFLCSVWARPLPLSGSRGYNRWQLDLKTKLKDHFGAFWWKYTLTVTVK